MHYNCLLVDDETELAAMTCEYFNMFDTSCAFVTNVQGCLAFLEQNTVDILLLDINLSEESGFALCKRLREQTDMPILFISARQSDDDVLIALNIGGDDYIKKPYSLSVLLAKVKVLLNRMQRSREAEQAAVAQREAETTCVRAGADESKKGRAREASHMQTEDGAGLYLSEETLSAVLRGKRVQLKAKEFALLKCLYDNRNKIVTKENLFLAVWGDECYGDGTLNVHIRKLREKLEENPSEPKLIQTVWGVGYMLSVTE
ncbi:MAG: response regulator transcription factor [Lachnospiraceae bacterium]|nr:response regulator transcription factor [Lachnospiraceae bacterium]